MGEIKDTLHVGKPVSQIKGLEPMDGTVVKTDARFDKDGRTYRGELFVNEAGLWFQGASSALAMRKHFLRVPLARWENVTRIEIDGHGYERMRGRTAFGLGGAGIGRVGGTHRAAETTLVLTTEARQVAYTLPIGPADVRNLLGTVIVDVDKQG